jgi:hypothetical protein
MMWVACPNCPECGDVALGRTGRTRNPLPITPSSCRFVAVFPGFGTDQTLSFIRVLDAGGLIWKGRRSYRSPDAALADAEAGVARWIEDELGMKAAIQT